MPKKRDDQFSEDETARRRDEVIRRMANTLNVRFTARHTTMRDGHLATRACAVRRVKECRLERENILDTKVDTAVLSRPRLNHTFSLEVSDLVRGR